MDKLGPETYGNAISGFDYAEDFESLDYQYYEESVSERSIGAPVFDGDDLLVGMVGTEDVIIEIEQFIDELDDEDDSDADFLEDGLLEAGYDGDEHA